MTKRFLQFATGIACLVFIAGGCASPSEPRNRVVMSTDRGDIVILLHDEKAPYSSDYVRGLVEAGRFDGTTFYRSAAISAPDAPNEFVEGGLLSGFVLSGQPTSVADTGLPTLETLETTDQTGLRHVRGAVSLARDVLDTGSAIPDIVVYLTDAPAADAGGSYSPDRRGYPVFGTVIKGIEIIDQIAAENRGGQTWVPILQGQILTNPLVIERAEVR